MTQEKIINYLSTGPVSSCPCAYLVSGKQEHEELNRSFLKENRTGHWILAEGRIFRGDAMFLLLPSPGYSLRLRRELYAGCINDIESSSIGAATKIVTVKKFHRLPDVIGSLRDFLGGRIPLAGNRVLSIWSEQDWNGHDEKKFRRKMSENSARDFMRLSATARNQRLAAAPRFPTRSIIKTIIFDRNPDVVVAVLLRANGICEGCHRKAPFIRGSDNTPYLEVHHRVHLACGGEDTIKNAEALCPNCHRQRHFGIN